MGVGVLLEEDPLSGSSASALVRLGEEELRVLVRVPVALMVLVRYVVLSSVELDEGVHG